MHVRTLNGSYAVRTALPYLWGSAAAAALDYVVDIRTLFLSVMAGAVVLSAGSVILWNAGR